MRRRFNALSPARQPFGTGYYRFERRDRLAQPIEKGPEPRPTIPCALLPIRDIRLGFERATADLLNTENVVICNQPRGQNR